MNPRKMLLVDLVKVTQVLFGESDSEEIENFLNDYSIPIGVENSSFNMEEDIIFLESLLNEKPSPNPPIIPNQTKSPIEEPNHSFSMGYEHFSISLVTKEVAESSTKNLVPILRECEVTSDNGSESIEPIKYDSLVFTTFSNPLFNNDEINSDEFNSHVESNSVEFTSNHDTVKFDNLDEFSRPFIPFHIAEEERIWREHADYINRMEMLFTINPRPHPTLNANTNVESIHSLRVENDDSDREVDTVDDLRVDNSEHESSESEDSDFDNPSVPLPPPEPPDEEFDFEIDFGDEILVMRNTIVKFECIDARVKFDVSNNENDDLSYFMFAKVFSFLFAESEDTIFDPGDSTKTCHTYVTKTNSPIRRHLTHSPSPKVSNSPPRVTAVKAAVVSAAQGNMSYLSNFEELKGGYVAFGGNLKGGKISRKGKIKIGKLDFDDVYFVKELKFNLFSVSQMCDKKNNVLFIDTECLVLSPDFKLPNESQVLLRVPRENNMYNVNLKNIVPSRDLTCLFTKAIIDESNLWHRRLGHINFKTMNKLLKGFEDPDHPDKVYKVVKALYGLHQDPRAWYKTLANYLLENGFQRGKIDQTLFIKRQKGVNTPRCDEDRLELMELTVFLLPKVEKIRIGVSVVDLQVSAVRHMLLLLVQRLLLFSLTNWCCSLSVVRSSIAVKKVNDVMRLQALVDKKKVVVTEAIIREALRLDDAEEPSIPSPTPPTPPPQPSQDIPSTFQVQPTPPQSPQGKETGGRNKVRVLKIRRLQKVGTSQRVETSDETVMDDVSNQGRMIAKMDQDADVVLEDDKEDGMEVADAVEDANVDESVDIQGRQAESQAETYKIDLDHANKVLSMQEDETEQAEIVPNEDDDVYTEATPLARKASVVDYQIIKLNNKPYYKIIRADDTHQLYVSFLSLLRNFDKEDLKALWSLVKERFSTTKPKKFSNDFLLVTLGAMFEKPDIHAQIWNIQRSVHGPAKLILLVERKYPLTRFTLDQMLNDVRLEVEDESEVSLELLRFIRQQHQEGQLE
nr:ribonuclease H-like domain-containing protein [Tanacetum cinerariifolium]